MESLTASTRLVKLTQLRELRRLRADLLAARYRAQYPVPGDLAMAVDPATVGTAALALIDAALVDVAEGRCDRLIISMPPQEGKSERISRRLPLWMLLRDPALRIGIASYEHHVARRWGRAIRNDIAANPDLGLVIRSDTSSAAEWQLDGHRGGVFCTGIGGALTGRPLDLLLIDDPVKDRKQADSKVYRDNVWDWWTNVARTRLAPGAPVVVILTRWHEDDLAGRLLAQDDNPWRVINIPAQADHRPEHGETDPLGREPGEWMISARGRTAEQWEQIRREVGAFVFASLYQGKPTPGSGNVFDREWWRFYDAPQWVERPDGSRWAVSFDEVVISWDMAFKDLDSSDWVVGQVWGRRGVEAFLLDQVRGRFSFVVTCQEVRALAARWPQASAKYVEDKANGTAVINALHRTVAGLIPVEPEGSKVARARAVSPFVEAGNVWLPAPEVHPWIDELIRECSNFPMDVNDDQVDALSQGLNRLLLNPYLLGDDIYEEDLDDDDRGGGISLV
jgi:predicted phage terminase large subunit-like protein